MTELLVQLERLAQAFPWERVSIDISREPEGKLEILAWMKGGDGMNGGDYGYQFARGNTVEEAVTKAIEQYQEDRNPEKLRQKAIEQLEAKIQKLRALEIAFPPYVPNWELCEHNPELQNYRAHTAAPIDV